MEGWENKRGLGWMSFVWSTQNYMKHIAEAPTDESDLHHVYQLLTAVLSPVTLSTWIKSLHRAS
jgi:hypothetical protein